MKTTEVKKEKIKYESLLSEIETELAISSVKTFFSLGLGDCLCLNKVEAPVLLTKGTGLNDDLNGIENPVTVNVKQMPGVNVEIVHSLAKWKRAKLGKLKSKIGEGLYTDMKALRPDEDFSDVHSIYVDQWDWEKVIDVEDRKLDYLKDTVKKIYQTVLDTERYISEKYPQIEAYLPKDIYFVHTEELQELYPTLTPKEREDKIAKEKGAVFIIGIGGILADGKKHDGRAPDYDDWSTPTSIGRKGLNGDIVVWNKVLGKAFEVSSMGIRVSPESLRLQLQITSDEERLKLDWHKKLVNGELPYTIGGGIGQSRLAMLLLQKKHIGEVQSSIWPEKLVEDLKKQNINLL